MRKEGKITKIFFDNGTFAIVLLKTDDGPIKCIGNIINPVINVSLEVEGEFETDPKWGPQFRVRQSHLAANMSDASLIAYLSSGYIKGVGQKTAKAIVDRFGDETLKVIKENPALLAEVPRITPKKAKEIHDSHMMHNAYMSIYDIFGGQVTDNQVKAIYHQYGEKAIKVIKENPYQLIYDIDGFGFKKVDKLALSYGIKPDDDVRVAAVIAFIIKTAGDDGHCFISIAGLEKHISDVAECSISMEKVADVLSKEIKDRHLVYEASEDRLYLKPLYDAEVQTAESIVEMADETPHVQILGNRINMAIYEMQREVGFFLTDNQKEAIRNAFSHRVSLITGGPGCGKTTIINAITKAWDNTTMLRLVAPTGKASRRMSELTGIDATTIHKELIRRDHEKSAGGIHLKKGLIVCDEASMLDLKLASKLVAYAQETQSALVLIGDINQLPPIGPGNFFRDLIKSEDVPKVMLDISHRNTGTVAFNAHQINNGQSMNTFRYDQQFQFRQKIKEEAFDEIVRSYLALAREFGVDDVCCIVPTRKDGGEISKKISSETLNRQIQAAINPGPAKMTGCTFREGDRVMQTSNDYTKGVFNGDCGRILSIEPDDNTILVRFDTGDCVEYTRTEANDSLQLAYAMTVHKSQGSEYQAIVLGYTMEHYIMLQRNLLYTGVTRAKRKVILIGDAKAVNMAIGSMKSAERNTALRQRIRKLKKESF